METSLPSRSLTNATAGTATKPSRSRPSGSRCAPRSLRSLRCLLPPGRIESARLPSEQALTTFASLRSAHLRVRQGAIARPSVRAWWFHRSASVPTPPRASAVVAPHGAEAPAPPVVALAALPGPGTNWPTSRSAGACSSVSRTGARWQLCRRPAASTRARAEKRRARELRSLVISKIEDFRRQSGTPSRLQSDVVRRQRSEHRRRLERCEAHGPG
jgi:hypothetical protein